MQEAVVVVDIQEELVQVIMVELAKELKVSTNHSKFQFSSSDLDVNGKRELSPLQHARVSNWSRDQPQNLHKNQIQSLPNLQLIKFEKRHWT